MIKIIIMNKKIKTIMKVQIMKINNNNNLMRNFQMKNKKKKSVQIIKAKINQEMQIELWIKKP